MTLKTEHVSVAWTCVASVVTLGGLRQGPTPGAASHRQGQSDFKALRMTLSPEAPPNYMFGEGGRSPNAEQLSFIRRGTSPRRPRPRSRRLLLPETRPSSTANCDVKGFSGVSAVAMFDQFKLSLTESCHQDHELLAALIKVR